MGQMISKYGLSWDREYYDDPVLIEMDMIRKGGFIEVDGELHGGGLLFHYLELRKLIWPKRYFHKWVELIYREIIANQVTILMGCASSGKSSTAAEYLLLDYWIYPENTLGLISTTKREKLEQAVFGEVKMLFKQARELRPWLEGHLIDYKQCIATHSIKEDDIRDLRCGIVGKALYIGGSYVGLGHWAGIKQDRINFLCDELQFCSPAFLECLDNMFSNPHVKVIGSGNPAHNPDDQLGIAAEPKEGWASVQGITKTTVWDTNFFHGRCVNLIGIDSPNFDVPEDEKEPFPKLIGRKYAKLISDTHGKNSPQVESQVIGRMCLQLAHSRVITREICRLNRAHDKAEWQHDQIVKLKGLDPAYGGGDRCITIDADLGTDQDGVQILKIYPAKLIRIDLSLPETPEQQIARAVFDDAKEREIPPQNIGYDSFGKGTVGFAFASVFGSNSPIPIDSGGRTTKRPVRHDLYVEEEIGNRRIRRLKRCDEHYSKFVTEMWFSVRYAIEAKQIRELPVDVMLEGCTREYEEWEGKIEVEPKEKMKERTGKSPDLFDTLAIVVEMARRRGFVIRRLGPVDEANDPFAWMAQKAREDRKWIHSKQLSQQKA